MTVVTTDDDGPGKHAPVLLGQPVSTTNSIRWYFRKQAEFYKVSLPLSHWLRQNVKQFDLVHIHALFSFSSTAAARAAQRARVPYIIRPLGVLNRWGMENRRQIIKALSFRFIENPSLRHASAIHYTSLAEQREAENTGAIGPAAVIPLGIDTDEFQHLPSPERFLEKHPSARSKKLVLFLSRLDAKKGLDLLLDSWAEIQKQGGESRERGDNLARQFANWLLVIAGGGEATFERELKQRAERLGIAEHLLWPGFLAGADKLAALASATVYVLPSYSENFGIALVEALAAGLPCITTTGVAVSEDMAAAKAGLVVTPEKTALTKALLKLMMDEPLRAELGANARHLAKSRFSLPAMGGSLESLYLRITGEKK